MYFVQQVLLPSSGSSLDSQLSLSLSGYEHGTGHYYYCNRAALCLCLTSSLSPCAHPRHLQILRSVDGITQPDRSVRQHLASCLALARRAAATCSSRMPLRSVTLLRLSKAGCMPRDLRLVCHESSSLPPSLPPPLARCPALLVCVPKRTDRPRRDARNSEGFASARFALCSMRRKHTKQSVVQCA